MPRRFLVKTLSTFFFIGYLPLIPGTFGSIAGLLLFWLSGANPAFHLVILSALLFIGLAVAKDAEVIFGRKDSSRIVIDEVCGMLIALLFLPADIRVVITAFLLFRILDAFKAWPASKAEELPQGIGVMADDIVAGIYTNIILQVVLRAASLTFS